MTIQGAQVQSLQIPQEELFLLAIFHPFMLARFKHAAENNTKFVHYTNADTAMRIFENEQIWLRKTSCMNDFMEIEHGFGCLNVAYKKHQELVRDSLGSLFSGIPEKLEKKFNEWLPHFRTDTYIACVSEHGNENTGDEEDRIGRLSMWRAYGGSTGVAIVMNNGPFLRRSSALNAYTSPVAYLGEVEFESEFVKLFESIKSNTVELQMIGEERVIDLVFNAFRYAVLCTKHPGFREEREWRVIYSPKYQKSNRLIEDIKTIGGTPQQIFKLPLKNVLEEGFYGAEIPELVDRVIIGPTNYPYAIREAIVSCLSKKGLADVESRVVVSDIPLRN
jgi:Protein of unknown function (DUF2971)